MQSEAGTMGGETSVWWCEGDVETLPNGAGINGTVKVKGRRQEEVGVWKEG